MSKVFPPWETELRALVREELRNGITSTTSDQNFELMWARNPLHFVEAQTTKTLLESWELFPAWRTEYERASRRGKLHELWCTLDVGSKRELARVFKDFFYRQKRTVAQQ
jgi:hypothetical protein